MASSKEKPERCEVVEGDCLDPAGYGNRVGTAENPKPPSTTFRCDNCHALCCSRCRIVSLCLNCAFDNQERQRYRKKQKKLERRYRREGFPF